MTKLTNGPILADGAMGTMLQELGLTDGGAPELWNVEKPDRVQKVHRGFTGAGAQLIATNTFGGTVARLKFHHIGDRVAELNRAGATIAREVADETGALVAGSIGPSGELIEPVGTLTMEEAETMFADQARALAEGGVDLFQIETMSHMNEVEAAVRGVRSVAPDTPICVTMSFDTNYHTMMGVSPSAAVQVLAEWGVDIAGANCGTGPEEVDVIMTDMALNRPDAIKLMVYCNAGLPEYVDGEIRYSATPDRMADYAVSMRNIGIDIIGGCCGSTPDHIRAISEALQNAHSTPIAGPDATMLASSPLEDADSRANRSASRRRSRHARRRGES
ncbi:MAG: homocysteine S-methyltransferase family protein [Chloroflexota bacterium]